MNKQAIAHTPCSKQCFALSSNTVELRLQTSKEDNFKITLIYGNKYDYYLRQERAQVEIGYSCNRFNHYTIKLELSDVRLVYIFEIEENGKRYYFSEDGISTAYDFTYAYYNAFQLPYINKADIHETIDFMRSAVFYEVFVDRFNRGDNTKDDSYINIAWGEKPQPKSFAGGDLRGIINKLSYIKGLGVNVLYLTPVFESISNHKYDISDYFLIDPQFGTNEDMKELVAKSHEMGIRVVLDAVFNHCSEHLPQFQDVVKKGRKSEFYDWFIIRGDFPSKEEQNYEVFASCMYMPKFNTSNIFAQEFLLSVGTHWIKEYDVDGWRLDVSDEVSHAFWRKFREQIKSVKKDAVIIGENWHDANPFLRGDEYDSIMNYAFTKACLDFFAKRKTTALEFAESLSALVMRNTTAVNEMMLNILDSHDTHRFFSETGNSEAALICALSVLYCYIGAPCLYYGTEINMQGGYDPDCRRTMDWQKAEASNITSSYIKKLSALKNTEPLMHGTISFKAENELFILERVATTKKLKLIVNTTKSAISVTEKNITLSYNYEKGRLKPFGFIIIEGDIK